MKKRYIITGITTILVLLWGIYIGGYIIKNNKEISYSNYYNQVERNDDLEYLTLSEIRDKKDEAINKIEEGYYENLHGKDVAINLAEEGVDKLYEIKETENTEPYRGIKDEETILEEEVKVIEHYFDMDTLDPEELIDVSTLTAEENGYIYITYDELKEKIKNGTYKAKEEVKYNLPGLAYTKIWSDKGDNRYIHITPEFNVVLIKGKLYEVTFRNKENGFPEDPEEDYEPIEIYYPNDKNLDDSYTLFDGKSITIKQAIDFTEDYFNNRLPYDSMPDVKRKVAKIEVFEVEEGKICLEFSLTRCYEGLIFNTGTINSVGVISSHKTDDFKAIMVDTDDIDEYIGNSNNYNKLIKTSKAITEIVSLDSALQALSENIGSNSRYEVESIEMIYLRNALDGNILNTENWEGKPAWKVACINDNDDSNYIFHVDMQTGRIQYEAVN